MDSVTQKSPAESVTESKQGGSVIVEEPATVGVDPQATAAAQPQATAAAQPQATVAGDAVSEPSPVVEEVINPVDDTGLGDKGVVLFSTGQPPAQTQGNCSYKKVACH